ncbi:NAD(P)H-binding protein [Actinomadura meridiana]|uniref:NAD(P)H-binding protein n=1 Tax=Actinomadura meridiana TaxID=559626 RepID=A0ABP8CHT9_9ACTN
MTNVLILGGTGKTGRRVAHRLQSRGETVRAASRGSDIRFDLDDPTTWKPALDGATAAYLVDPETRPNPATDPRERIPRLVPEAVDAGVRRLVLLSAPGVEFMDDHPLAEVEQAVRDSGVAWTILRPSWFSQNFSEAFFLPGVLSGTLSLPTGDGRTPFIDAEDIADVAASALTDDRHDGQIYDLTGPRAITFGEVADLIGKATGRTVRYEDVDPRAYVERQIAGGVPPTIAEWYTRLFATIRDGTGEAPTDDVERALGRAPRRFEDYVTETAAAGHWN